MGHSRSCPALRAEDRGDAPEPAAFLLFPFFFACSPQGEQHRKVVEGTEPGGPAGALPVSRAGPKGTVSQVSGVEVWRGGLGGAYPLPTLSFVGASLAPPCSRFHTPLIEPDVRICRIRLSEKTHAIALAIACDAVCNF